MEQEIHPLKSTVIEGAIAQAVAIVRRPIPEGAQLMSVKDAMDIDKALGDPENSHCCPLCNEFFPTIAFRAHAQQCIDARAPRRRIWTPPGFSRNAIQHFKDRIKPDFVENAKRNKN